MRHDPEEESYVDLLLRAGEILSHALAWEETVDSVTLAVVETIADICILDLKNEEGQLHLASAAHRDAAQTGRLRHAGRYLSDRSRGVTHPALSVAASRTPVYVPVVDDVYLANASVSGEHERFMRAMGYRSMMIVPVVSEALGSLGALTFVRTDPEAPAYSAEALRFATDLARRCATSISKARLYAQTLHIATVFQRAALPATLPTVAGMSMDGFYEPSSEHLLVGGDWYDAFELRDGRVAITVGDVLGHGVEAAVWMSRLRNGLRAALISRPDPAHALVVGNEMLQREFGDNFTTAIVAIYDPALRTLSCASAGHPGPIVWCPQEGVTDPLEGRGLPLGLFDLAKAGCPVQTLAVGPGSFVAFFTDGLLEWNRDIATAWRALQAAVQRQEIRTAQNPAHAIRAAIIEGHKHHDDVAVLTVRFE